MEFHSILAEDLIHYKNHSINKPSTNSDARFFQGIFSARARPSSPTRMTRHSSPFSKYPRKEGEGRRRPTDVGKARVPEKRYPPLQGALFGHASEISIEVRPSSQVRAICKWFDGGGGACLTKPAQNICLDVTSGVLRMHAHRAHAPCQPTATENDELRLVVTHPAENLVNIFAATEIGSW